MSDSCSAIHSFSHSAKDAFLQHRLLITLTYLFFINLFLDHVQTQVLPRITVYKHLQAEACQEMCMRTLQLFVGPIIFLSGLGFLLYQAITGCSATEIYIFYISGISLVTIDIHEFVRRWPLRAPLFAHHIMTFVLALATVELQIFPSQDWTNTLFLTNIGLMWTVDFYHVIYRTSGNLSLMKKLRKVYMFFAPVRIVNIVLLLLGSILSALEGGWSGFACLSLMTVAYTYNSYKAITFMMNFDCASYYNAHQGKWLNEEEDQQNPTPSKKQGRALSQSLSTFTHKQGRKFSQALSISLTVQDQPAKLLPGLRGDKVLDFTNEGNDSEHDDKFDDQNSA